MGRPGNNITHFVEQTGVFGVFAIQYRQNKMDRVSKTVSILLKQKFQDSNKLQGKKNLPMFPDSRFCIG